MQGVKGRIALLERHDIFVVALLILVAFTSFGLGRISKNEASRDLVVIEQWFKEENNIQAGTASVSSAIPENNANNSSAIYVASKNGTKYHFTWCSGAKSISEANKIWFETPEAARAAGYTPAANCKGLK